MASCQILWKNLRKSGQKTCETHEEKLVENRILDFFGRISWWKNTFYCGLFNKIHTVAAVVVEKSHQIRPSIIFMKPTIST